MSVPRFGNIMPVHGEVLRLIGWDLSRGSSELITDESERVEMMRQGHAELVRQTGVDYGFDLARWRTFLLQPPDRFGYRHPYAFAWVDHEVRRAVDDPKFRQIAAIAATGDCEWRATYEEARARERQVRLDIIAAKDSRITTHTCPFCGKPCPSYRVTCKHCGEQVRERSR
jgi:hypothetical protein